MTMLLESSRVLTAAPNLASPPETRRGNESADFERVAQAIALLRAATGRRPISLADIAACVGLSPEHFQRVFTRWAGLSPKRFQQFQSVEYLKSVLDRSRTVFDAACDPAISGAGRLHDLFVTVEALTPGEYRARGRGLSIRYGFFPTRFGDALVARTERGICALAFAGKESREALVTDLRERWSGADLSESLPENDSTVRNALRALEGDDPRPVSLVVKGTNLQIKVWSALLRVPGGALVSYEQLAAATGAPTAVRAVASAVGANPISYLIPCHRVIRKSGVLGDYRWGPARKAMMVASEVSAATERLDSAATRLRAGS